MKFGKKFVKKNILTDIQEFVIWDRKRRIKTSSIVGIRPFTTFCYINIIRTGKMHMDMLN